MRKKCTHSIWIASLLISSVAFASKPSDGDGKKFRCVSTHAVQMGQGGRGSDEKRLSFTISVGDTRQILFENSRTSLEIEVQKSKVILLYQSMVGAPALKSRLVAKKTLFSGDFELFAESSTPYSYQMIQLCCSRVTDQQGGS